MNWRQADQAIERYPSAAEVSSGASFGIRLHRGSHVLTPGEHRNRTNCALSALPVRLSIFSRITSAFHCAFPLALKSALYCASPFMDYQRTWWRRVDLNHRPLGYEPSELPDCSTPLKSFYSRPKRLMQESFKSPACRFPPARLPDGDESPPGRCETSYGQRIR